MNGKIETYIGFAIKKGAVVFGCDGIKRCRKKVYLLLATESLSEKSFEVVTEASKRLGCKVLKIDDFDVLSKKNCKALAVCDKSLAEAILNVK